MVIGSELLITQRKFDPLTFEQDFNFPRPEWVGRFDFVYSNSYDHAFDLPQTLRVWASQLTNRGVMILEHSPFHVEASETDPTGVTIQDLIQVSCVEVGLKRVGLLRFKAADNQHTKRYVVLQRPKGWRQAV